MTLRSEAIGKFTLKTLPFQISSSPKQMINYSLNFYFVSIRIVYLRFVAHRTSLWSPSKYKNISLMHFSLIFQPMSLNSKNRTIDVGLNVSNIKFKFEIDVPCTSDTISTFKIALIIVLHIIFKIVYSFLTFMKFTFNS